MVIETVSLISQVLQKVNALRGAKGTFLFRKAQRSSRDTQRSQPPTFRRKLKVFDFLQFSIQEGRVTLRQ